MSYVVLARKYRPRNFAQMAGQEHVVRALTNALVQKRLHHAYLFTGTRGIGKTTVSRILAKSLNCTGPDGLGDITAEPCGVCSACTEIDADRYIDYVELDAASNRSIDEIRDLIERAAYKPGVGRFKVFMIDEAHQLTKDAFNALLKTLEEPPEYLKFVLATTDPERMLPTVLSRCLQFNLRPMAPEVVRVHLASVLETEGVPHDDAGLRLIARAARGSMRDALSLTDQAIAYGAGRFDEAVVRGMLGTGDDRVAADLVRALAARDGPAVLACADQVRVSGLSAVSTLDRMAQLLQQMAVEQAVPGALPAGDLDAQPALELASLLTPEETQLLYSMALQGQGELSLMSDEYAAFTMVMLRFLAFAPAEPGPTAAMPRPQALRAPPPPALAVPARPPKPGPAAPAPAGVVASSLTSIDGAPASSGSPERVFDTALADRWNEVVRRLIDASAVSGLVRELAWQGGLFAIEPGDTAVWRLCIEHESLRMPALRDKLSEALGRELAQVVRVEVDAGDPGDSPARREAAVRARRQQEAEQAIRTDPAVRELLAQFKGARIVPGSIKPI